METIKVLATNGMDTYVRFLRHKDFPKIIKVTQEEFLDGADVDLIVFTGGQDVSPIIYGDTPHRTTYSHADRDIEELKIYMEATRKNISKVGICRGAQFLTAMQPNGFLIQDIAAHNNNFGHLIRDVDTGKEIIASSVHHQMMYPYEVKDHKIIAISSQCLSGHYSVGNPKYHKYVKYLKNIQEEPEIVLYKKDKALCIQGHPEYFRQDEEYPTYCRKLIKDLIL